MKYRLFLSLIPLLAFTNKIVIYAQQPISVASPLKIQTATCFIKNAASYDKKLYYPTNSPAQSGHQISFSGKTEAGSTVILFWRCTDTIRTLYYELQRGNDSSHFVPILLMHAKTAARNAIGYTYPDAGIKPGLYYYRLRIEDMDGKETFSPVLICSLNTSMEPATIEKDVAAMDAKQ